jgi:hypothetical protein
MPRRNWKTVYATSLRNAMELCVEYAREKGNQNIERIADRLGMASHFTLYKWMESGRLPAIMIRPFEHACGIDFVTQFLAHSNDKLIVAMPNGRNAEHRDLNDLSLAMHQTAAQLIQYYEGDADAAEVIANITLLIEGLAYQRGNIHKQQQPQLELNP